MWFLFLYYCEEVIERLPKTIKYKGKKVFGETKSRIMSKKCYQQLKQWSNQNSPLGHIIIMEQDV